MIHECYRSDFHLVSHVVCRMWNRAKGILALCVWCQSSSQVKLYSYHPRVSHSGKLWLWGCKDGCQAKRSSSWREVACLRGSHNKGWGELLHYSRQSKQTKCELTFKDHNTKACSTGVWHVDHHSHESGVLTASDLGILLYCQHLPPPTN